MEIKLVACDLDGTLLGKDEVLPEKAVAAIKQLEERGIPFTFATGRLPYMIDDYARQIGLTYPVVSCNGSILYQGDDILAENAFLVKPLRQLIEAAVDMGMTVVYSIKGKEYVLFETAWVLEKRRKFNRYHDVHSFAEEEWGTVYVDKVNIVDEVRDGRVRELHPYSDPLEEQCTISHYGNVGMEIVAKGTTKATGLVQLSRRLNIPVQHMMAIGDSENDNAMLEMAGFGVAVGNAMESTKACADYICEGHGADGVIEAIRKFILSPNHETSI